MKRIQKYREFRKMVKWVARKISAAETSPLGRDSINEIWRADTKYKMLNAKWKQRVDRKVERDLATYHKPVVQGKNGEWFSEYEMDMAMMGY